MSLILSGSDGLSDIDGSAATPAIRGTDANTGIFFPAADTIAFAEGGVEAARFDSAGNLGLGTTSPSARLDVQGTSAGGYIAQVLTNNSSTGYVQQALKIGASGANGSGGTFYAPTLFYKIGITGNDTTTPIIFVNNNDTERARITSDGDLLVGKTSSGATVGVEAGANGLVRATKSGTTSATSTMEVYSTGAGTYRFFVGMNGTVYATNTVISALSDQRFKENIRDLNAGLAEVMSLKPRLYDWKEGKGQDIKNARGFIAQEFETVFPDLIDTWKDPAPEGEEPYKSVRQDLIPVLVKAIQEQQAIITQLQADVAALKAV